MTEEMDKWMNGQSPGLTSKEVKVYMVHCC